MHLLYLVSVWFHVIAATVWLGGMAFLVLVIVPWIRRGNHESATRLLHETGTRFRLVGWICLIVAGITGTFNLWVRGIRFQDFVQVEWLSSSFGQVVLFKVGAFAVVVAVSLVHDFAIGPRATVAMLQDPTSPRARSLRRMASWLGRANVILALILVAIGIVIVRGLP